jgi:RES domain-containing protein
LAAQPPANAAIGAQWVVSGQSAALVVPSTLVPQQVNVLIDPVYPGFAGIAATARSEPFHFAPRRAA